MLQIELLQKLANEKNTPCVTLTMNTHRTHPDNLKDTLLLKNLVKEAESRIISQFGKRPVLDLLSKLTSIEGKIDPNYNLDSLHVYLSNDTEEIIRSPYPSTADSVHIGEAFFVRPLIKMLSRQEQYLILLLSQSGVQLYDATNDKISAEIKNEHFPIPENRLYNTFPDKGSDPKHLDDLVREFLNRVDKALVAFQKQSGLACVVICTGDNYSRLLQVADNPGMYIGHAAVNYNDTSMDTLAKQAWEIVRTKQQQHIMDQVSALKEIVSEGKVLTDLQEIYQAAQDGRGDVLFIHQDFSQPVMMKDARTFELITDPKQEGAVEDITSAIASEVLGKKGRVIFTSNDEIKELGDIVLRVRY